MESCEIRVLHEDAILEAQNCLVDEATAAGLAETFQALSDPNRVRMISALIDRELCVCDLAALLGMTQSAVSHQLRLLRDLRVVRNRKEGRVVYYTVDDDHISDLFRRGLEHYAHRPEQEKASPSI